MSFPHPSEVESVTLTREDQPNYADDPSEAVEPYSNIAAKIYYAVRLKQIDNKGNDNFNRRG
jgi:hypothetical protein